MTPTLSIIIPARNEEWLNLTVDDILRNSRGNTEIIVILDGEWPHKPLDVNPRVRVIHHSESIGQRAACNEGVRLSEAKYVMKCDAHCSFAEGFDVTLMDTIQPDWTVVPLQYNFHVFDWECCKCGERWYMGPQPEKCHKEGCDGKEFKKTVVWKRRKSRWSCIWRFDSELHFQYWDEGTRRVAARKYEVAPKINETMTCLGACWMLERKRYLELDMQDEQHGSWGQQGVEVACKSWLSGGKLVCNRNAWFAHMFRTQDGFGFPYPNPGITTARRYSQDLWRNNKWPKQVHKLSWLIEKFWPVEGWTEEQLQEQKGTETCKS